MTGRRMASRSSAQLSSLEKYNERSSAELNHLELNKLTEPHVFHPALLVVKFTSLYRTNWIDST